jgi:hypothetical protein
MNTTKLKAYAPAARTAFIEAVTRRAGVLGIREDRVEEVTEAGDIALIGGQPFPRSIVPLRKELLERIKADGFAQVMEAMAYTWFNRFVALRFMELKAFVEELNKLHPGGRLKNQEFYFRENLTYNALAGGDFSCRHNPPGFLFDTKGSCIFIEQRLIWNLLGFLNSRVSQALLDVLCPTLDYSSIGLNNTPYKADEKGEELVKAAVTLAAADWDNFETSWDFRDQPLLRPTLKGETLEASWRNWETQSTTAIRRMQELETENNRLFIAAYGLEGELQPEVPEEQITLARADAKKDMAAFLSYAVGCMMGRYSLDAEGLICANAGDTVEAYLEKIAATKNSTFHIQHSTFHPDSDAIIPVLDGEWFEDDIVARTRDFLRATFGEATLNENLEFLKQSLGKDLRTYFLNDFGKDHLQTYKNRPIYWLFSSGKEKAFQCLVYLHRYHSGTLARMRTEYVIPLQGKLNARIAHLEEEKAHATTSAQGKKLQNEQDKLKKQQAELIKFDEQLRHYADQKITLDLDDGVKVNYAKFGPLVAESKKVCGTKED